MADKMYILNDDTQNGPFYTFVGINAWTRLYYISLGTSIIWSPMTPPSLKFAIVPFKHRYFMDLLAKHEKLRF